MAHPAVLLPRSGNRPLQSRVLVWLLGCWLFFGGCLGCLATPVVQFPEPSTAAVRQQIAWLSPENEQLGIGDVSQANWAARFVSLPDTALDLGFQAHPVWVKMALTSTVDQEFWVELSNPLIEQVEWYKNNELGDFSSVIPRGPIASGLQQLNTRRHVFSVQLKADQTQVVFLRLQSRTSLSTSIAAHLPSALMARHERESFVWGLGLGAYLLVVLFYAIFWTYTQERVHLYYTLYIASNFAAAFFSSGWNHALGLPPGAAEQSKVIGVLIALPVLLSAVFSVEYLRVRQSWPRASLCYVAVCLAFTLGLTTTTWLGHYNKVAVGFQFLTIGLIAFTTVALMALSYQGHKSARLLLYAFTIFHLGVVWRYLRNIGFLEANDWNDNAYQIGAFIHMLIMSLGIFSNYRSLQKGSHELKARADAEASMRQRQSQFLNMVSHEIRTPLAVILACTDNIQAQRDLREAVHARAQKIQRHVEKIEKIFSNYLNNAQLLNGQSPVRMRHMDLSMHCKLVVQDFQDSRPVVIDTDIQAGVHIQADPNLIDIALHNLLDNAAKYAGAQGTIRLVLCSDGAVARLAVIDCGPGISPLDLPHIFESYYRGENTQGQSGLGLGLNLVQYIVQQHAGRITAQANPQGGMTFSIELPMSPAPQPKLPPPSALHQRHVA